MVQPYRPVQPGDRVAVVSPAWASPSVYPELHERALGRIRDVLGLEPVEYPTTRVVSSPEERARDLMAAFGDPSIRAVLATIGGDDQITVLRHLDPTVMTADPKPFLGYSDNTNLLNWLWFHGVAGVHGGSTQVHLAPGPAVEEEHLVGLRAALFGGTVELAPVSRTRDVGISWLDERVYDVESPGVPASPWEWHGFTGPVTGPTWGGCLEIVNWTLAVGRYVKPLASYDGCVLLLEASEELMPTEEVYRSLRNLGERGLLSACAALLWGRPPVTDRDHPLPEPEAEAARAERREAVLRAMREYAPGVPLVLDVDFGHTSPQYVLPYGGRVTLDPVRSIITAAFG